MRCARRVYTSWTTSKIVSPSGTARNATVHGLPDSLRRAIQTFFLVNALRDLRAQADQPRSMLINVSRFKNVQAQVFALVESEVSAIRNAIQLHGPVPDSGHSEINALRELYRSEFPDEPALGTPLPRLSLRPSQTSESRSSTPTATRNWSTRRRDGIARRG